MKLKINEKTFYTAPFAIPHSSILIAKRQSKVKLFCVICGSLEDKASGIRVPEEMAKMQAELANIIPFIAVTQKAGQNKWAN